ncbi:MOSC domain-containing protein [Paenibacillus sp. N3/727]|uniref:MOSC domain-containing protein n=1 Tax=Paenibacillus sp. N3/727 TaxID=2925845 RepID=UPI001F53E0FB|nr:MOSC domain-containing protein [Paenibacillus sp. N3/727]UNK18142.1 MOSC domain-containing protein [Paenibacillus sp. N3/727]
MTAGIGIVSLNVGKPVTVDYLGKDLSTGIYKQPVQGPLYLGSANFTGDGQADLVNHGGPDKAVCVYPFEHYAYWEEVLGKKMEHASFGENLTVRGLLEDTVCIGDVFKVGDAVVQVSQPRYPCFKLSQKHGVKDMPAQVLTTGYSGFYLRVLEEGHVSADSQLVQLESHPAQVTVLEVLKLLTNGRQDETGLRRMVEIEALAEKVRHKFEGWIEKLQ